MLYIAYDPLTIINRYESLIEDLLEILKRSLQTFERIVNKLVLGSFSTSVIIFHIFKILIFVIKNQIL